MASDRVDPFEAQLAGDLAEPGWSVLPGFLAAEPVRALAEEARSLRATGAFRPARIGRGLARAQHPALRGDEICWIDPASASPAQRDLLARLESLRLALNRSLQLGLFELEAHLSVYPPGACYQRHLDAFRGGGHRSVSMALYLNERWRPEDGGALRLHVGAQRAVEVVPLGGTLVAFRSERFEHEVLPAARERLSVAGWFLQRRGP